MTLHDRLYWPFTPERKHFGKNVSPDHFRINKDGTVQVSLAGNWPQLVQSLGSFSDVVTTTNNDAASVSQTGCYPDFKFCPYEHSAFNLNCGLMFDFPAWRRVWATRRQCDDGVWRTLLVAGHDNFANHQVLFPVESGDEQFNQLVRKFSPSIDSSNVDLQRSFWPLNHSRDMQRPGHLERFRRRKHEFVENEKNGARSIHPESLAEVWRNVLAERIWLNTTVVTAPVVHSTLWQPTSFAENSLMLLASSNDIFFRCHLGRVAGLRAVPLSQEPGSSVALEAYGAHNDLLFVLAVPTEWGGIWNELLHWLPAI